MLFGAQEPKRYQLLFMQKKRNDASSDDLFGVGALCAARACPFSEKKLGQMLSTEFQAMMPLVKASAVGVR